MNPNIPAFDFLEITSGAFLENLITDTPLTKSGYLVALSGYCDENPGLEAAISYHSISHSEVTVDCDKFYTLKGWINIQEQESTPPEGFPGANNKAAAKLIGLGPSPTVHNESILISHASKSIKWQNLDLLIQNTALFPMAKRVTFTGGTGIEFDWFNYQIRIKGAESYYLDNLKLFNAEVIRYYDYQISNSPFLVGPFVKTGITLQDDPIQSAFFLDGFLKVAALYNKNNLKQCYLIGETADSLSLAVDCTPNFAFNNVNLHGQVALGLGYTHRNCETCGATLSVYWELNEFLQFFPENLFNATQNSLGYQGLTATLGVYF